MSTTEGKQVSIAVIGSECSGKYSFVQSLLEDCRVITITRSNHIVDSYSYTTDKFTTVNIYFVDNSETVDEELDLYIYLYNKNYPSSMEYLLDNVESWCEIRLIVSTDGVTDNCIVGSNHIGYNPSPCNKMSGPDLLKKIESILSV
jgi:septin family protein